MARKQRGTQYAGQPVKREGEWPTLEPMPTEDDAEAAGVAIGAIEKNLDGGADDLTPQTLIGEHRPA